MRSDFLLLAALAVLASSPVTALCQWGARGCDTVVSLMRGQAETAYEWRREPPHEGCVYLWKNGVQIGGYCYADGMYRDLANGVWSGPAVAPIRPPLEASEEMGLGTPLGVVAEKIGSKERLWCGDTLITTGEAIALLTEGVPSDNHMPSLTVAAKDKETAKQARKMWDTHEAFAPARGKVRFQSYDLSNPVNQEILKPLGLHHDPQYAQEGVVVLAQGKTDAKTGRAKVEKVAYGLSEGAMIDALRPILPDVFPKTPALPAVPTLPEASAEMAAILVGVGLLIVVAFRKSHP